MEHGFFFGCCVPDISCGQLIAGTQHEIIVKVDADIGAVLQRSQVVAVVVSRRQEPKQETSDWACGIGHGDIFRNDNGSLCLAVEVGVFPRILGIPQAQQGAADQAFFGYCGRGGLKEEVLHIVLGMYDGDRLIRHLPLLCPGSNSQVIDPASGGAHHQPKGEGNPAYDFQNGFGRIFFVFHG